MPNWLLNKFGSSRILKKINDLSIRKAKNNLFVYRGSGRFDSEMSDHLNIMAESLETIYKNVEPSFVQLGQDLQSVYSDAADLTERALKSTRLVAGEADDNVLANIGTLAEYSLTELQSCHAEVSDKLDNTNIIAGHLVGLNRMCAVIDKIAMILRAVATYIGVESSRSAEASEMFTNFVQEIKELVEKINLVSESIIDDSKAASASQVFAYGKISEGLSQLSKLIGAAEQDVRNAVLEAEQIVKLSLEALEQVGHHSREISRQVGEIVVAIQFHDITRQKVEHLAETLYDTGRLLVGKTSDNGFKKIRAERLGNAHSILRLQSEQLKQVVTEIKTAYKQIVDAFGKIDDEVDGLVNSAAGLTHNSSQEGQTEDPFAILNSALLDFHRLLSRGRDLEDNLEKTAGQASEASAQVSRHLEDIRGINHEMHIKSLNAIVKTAHLGEKGKTLDVLAQEVSKLSGQSNEFVGDVMKVLDSIAASAQRLGQTEEVQVGDGDSGMSIKDGIQEISGTYERFREESSDASQRAEALQMRISQTSSGLVFLTELADQLTENLTELERIVEELESQTSLEDRDATAGISQIAARYTMESERAIHKEIVDLPDSAIHQFETEDTQEPPKVDEEIHEEDYSAMPEKTDGEDDMGDNIELF